MSDSVDSDKSKWLRDDINPDFVQLHRIRRVLFSGRTRFQSVDIVETGSFGICLVLDGKIQSSARDEFIYHETLVHPAMLAHPNPKAVFIAGGGEGATLRDVLAHKTVERAVMVDIDEEVVDICHRHLSAFHRGSFDDPRAEVYFADARGYLQETRDRFDVVIIDLVEPLEIGPACLLYTREFYQLLKERLNPGGIASIHSGASGWTNSENFAAVVRTLKSVFPIVRPYQVYVPSFVDMWGFTSASDTIDPTKLRPKQVDRLIAQRLPHRPRSYDGISHRALFMFSKHLRRQMAATRRIITDANPATTYSGRA